MTNFVDEASVKGRAADQSEQSRPRILVADDSSSVRELLRELLVDEGFEVLACRDGMEAVSELPRYAPDLLITDICMPVMDGVELIRRVRAWAPWAHLPIIVASSLGPTSERVRSVATAYDAYVAKPIDLAKLLTCIHAQVARPRS